MPVLVIRDEAFAEELRERGVEVTVVAAPTAEAVAQADVVVYGTTPGESLPEDARDVLAAGCLLVTCADPGSGLRPGVDHLAAGSRSWACDLVEQALAQPAAFAVTRRFAVVSAAALRAG